jgi:hypothetical protein
MALPSKLLSYIGTSPRLGLGRADRIQFASSVNAYLPNEHPKMVGSWPWPISSSKRMLVPAAVTTRIPLR